MDVTMDRVDEQEERGAEGVDAVEEEASRCTQRWVETVRWRDAGARSGVPREMLLR
jgi:hypothetical protein